ncbi:glycosyltransferase family 2 protein [Sphingobacterium puteale]|uniref:glycosyltransferase family 2 protein n=1 Tax=Sphingobacterium puteale TaxID=2420510 RepID=UPI003D993906
MKFSVIIPCFNVGKYLKSTIDSVIGQKGNFELEIILVDDCSTDNTWDIINSYVNNQIICLRNIENRGVSYTRNVGISNSCGDFIYFLDGDDLLLPNSFSKIAETLRNNTQIDIYSFGYELSYHDRKKMLNSPQYNNRLFEAKKFLELFLRRRVKQCMCSFVVKRDLFSKHEIHFDSNTYSGEDQEVQILCMYFANEIFYSSDILFVYQMRDGSFMKSNFNKRRFTTMDVYKRLFKRIHDFNLKTLLSTYFTVEYFSLLRHASKSGNSEFVLEALTHRSILNDKTEISLDKQSLLVLLLKMWHKIGLKLLLNIFRKY